MSERLVLADNGTYTATFMTRETDNGIVTDFTDDDTGIWSQTGSNLTVTASDGRVTSPTNLGNYIILKSGLVISVYRRQ